MEQPEPGLAGSASVSGGASSTAALPSDVNPNIMTALLVILAVVVVGSVVGIGRSLADSGPGSGTMDPIRRRATETAAEISIVAPPRTAAVATGSAASPTTVSTGPSTPDTAARSDKPGGPTTSVSGAAAAPGSSTTLTTGSPAAGGGGLPVQAPQPSPGVTSPASVPAPSATETPIAATPAPAPATAPPATAPPGTAPPATAPPPTAPPATAPPATSPPPTATPATAPPTTAPPTTLGPVASAQPTGLRAIAGQQKAVIAWDVTGSLSSLGGFRIEGIGRPFDVGADTRNFEFRGLAPSTAYGVAVIPLDGSGRPDVDGRATVSFTTLGAALAPVGPARDIVVTPGPGSLTISWKVDEVPAITGFFVSWGDVTYVSGVALHNGERSYIITGLRSGVAYTIDIQTFDENFNVVGSTRRTVHATAG